MKKSWNHPDRPGHSYYKKSSPEPLRKVGEFDVYPVSRGSSKIPGSKFNMGVIVVLTGMTAVPTPGFFGIYELACVAALKLWFVDPTLSRTFAIVLHLGQFIFILLLGGVFLFLEGLSLKDLSKKIPANSE